jgi:hypothetical protein
MLFKKNLLGVTAGAALAVSLAVPGFSYAAECCTDVSASSTAWKCEGGKLLVDTGSGYTDISTSIDESTWNSFAGSSGYSFSQFQSAYSDASRYLCGSTAAAKTTQQRVSTTQTVGLISQRASGTVRSLRGPRKVDAAMLEGQTGLSAGAPGTGKTGLWANYDHTRARDQAAGSDTRMNNFVLGGDYKIMDKLAAGASLSFQRSDQSFGALGQDSDAWTFAPYGAYLINDNMSLDAVVGYTWMDSSGVAAAGDTRRYFVASNLNAFTTDLGKWDIGGHVGFMYVRDDVDSTPISAGGKSGFLQAKTGIETAYLITNNVQPYLTLDYEQDLVYDKGPQKYDDTGFIPAIGVRVDLPSSLLGELRYGKTYGRRDFEQDAFTANMRMNF